MRSVVVLRESYSYSLRTCMESEGVPRSPVANSRNALSEDAADPESSTIVLSRD